MKKMIQKWVALVGFYGLIGALSLWGSYYFWQTKTDMDEYLFNRGFVSGVLLMSGFFMLIPLLGEIILVVKNAIKKRLLYKRLFKKG